MSIWDELKLVHLASRRSFERGLRYYFQKKVLGMEILAEGVFKGEVSGSNHQIYQVEIYIHQPRKSNCTCPFAAGRQVVCKHMVALYFQQFPEQAQAVLDYWEQEEREKEMLRQAMEDEMRLLREQKLQKITAYVDKLTPDQLREELIETLMKMEELTSQETDVFYEEEDYEDDWYDEENGYFFF
ncbi:MULTISPECIES: SWIM zinc finger family protein [unclassified Streptococcus]|uniref:SWIM zinc finger family protein n=1 Tax=unclassified Streptococcus TaxID=2608887 RepID=UPI0018A8C4DC|nr:MULTISPECIES: SWIM zinc finger family protein [unclassified Streptococcus]MBF8970566.1 SWIM zinc finger family protein [Streptococcus sp. NLN76]MBG9367642.1 SWIM zinc finger family protein [Streptococcus sp. NLN64]